MLQMTFGDLKQMACRLFACRDNEISLHRASRGIPSGLPCVGYEPLGRFEHWGTGMESCLGVLVTKCKLQFTLIPHQFSSLLYESNSNGIGSMEARAARAMG